LLQGEVGPAAPVETPLIPPSSPAGPTAIPFRLQTLDPGPKVGAYSALAADPAGSLALVYLDDAHDSLKLAVRKDNTWSFTSLSAPAPAAVSPALVFDRQGRLHLVFATQDKRLVYGSLAADGWTYLPAADRQVSAIALALDDRAQPLVAFFDVDSQQVRVAAWNGNGFTTQTIGPGDPHNPALSLAVPKDGLPQIAYTGPDGVRTASLAGGTWQSEVVGAGRDPALALAADGAPFIAFAGGAGGAGNSSVASSANPGPKALMLAFRKGGAWQTQVVDNSETPQAPSMVMDAAGRLLISYYEPLSGTLKFAQSAPMGAANGAPETTWAVQTVDVNRSTGRPNALALEGQGSPVIAYADGANRALKLAVAPPFTLSTPSGVPGRRGAVAPTNPEGINVQALYSHGQTFITWTERGDLKGETYRVYRSDRSITANTLQDATVLAEVGKGSARFYANRFIDNIRFQWHTRYSTRLVLPGVNSQIPDGTGLLVWTLATQDFTGQTHGTGYYAVTVIPAGESEQTGSIAASAPIQEAVADPQPVEITGLPGIAQDPGKHIYIQYMDLRRWNPTFHAPNPSNAYYGLDPKDPSLAADLQYAYDYVVYTPTAEMCGGKIPEKLAVTIFLHGWRGNRYTAAESNPYGYCAYGIYPNDQSETWWFGFARNHNYRQPGPVGAGDVIENFTEQRVLRMLSNVLQAPPGPPADPQRAYVFGHSMGGSGTLGFALRYPTVFAAAYSGEPITNFLTAPQTDQDWVADGAIKWGPAQLNLPVFSAALNGWAAGLQQHNGAGVWDWQNYLANLAGQGSLPASSLVQRAEDIVPLGIDMGIKDTTIIYDPQGRPVFLSLEAGLRTWGGAATNLTHQWSEFAYPLPSLVKNPAPFWNFTVVRSETVPALSALSANPALPPDSPTTYNQTILWSSSWDAWDGAPVDQLDLWQMSFCAVAAGEHTCGSGADQTVTITPRRVQRFTLTPLAKYTWENRRVSDGALVANGTVTAGADGLITVPSFQVSPAGNRLVLKPEKK
jgi:pimeloyl-ACP methyl ester carboxylesterase